MDIDVRKMDMRNLYKITEQEENSKEQKREQTELKSVCKDEKFVLPTADTEARLLNSMKYLAMQNQFNFVSLNKKDFKGIKRGVSKFRFDDQNVTVYNSGEKVHVQVIGRKRADFNDIRTRFEEFEPVETNFTDGSNGVNGKIDELVQQGGSGDCWLISGVLALNSTEEGKQIIKESVISNDDGSVTVNFRGLDLSYTVTPYEIEKYDTDKNSEDLFSNGDNDMLALEIAVSKLKNDISRGKVKLDVSEDSYEGIRDKSIEGGYAQQMIYFLTGKTSDTKTVEFSENQSDREIQEALAAGISEEEVYSVLEKAAENMPSALTFGLYFEVKRAQCTDGNWFNFDVTEGGHAFAITDIDAENKTVTFVNPWDSTEKFTMDWEEFAGMGIGMLTSAQLDKAEVKAEEPVQEEVVEAAEEVPEKNNENTAVITEPKEEDFDSININEDSSVIAESSDEDIIVSPEHTEDGEVVVPEEPVNPYSINIPALENWSDYMDFSVVSGLDEQISSDFSNLYQAVESIRGQLLNYMNTKYREFGFIASPISINRSINRIIFAEVFMSLNKQITIKEVLSNIMQTVDATIYGMGVFFSFRNLFNFGTFGDFFGMLSA